ncbi:hypothetical protein [Crateriforma spongiae]|uniref:hypothetical protein n=1 Tax=Crateriforma spongiae TaxID=2724528 RepID=UPI001444C5E9|nr:hypothetical protein [Crateriforma spongiae]
MTPENSIRRAWLQMWLDFTRDAIGKCQIYVTDEMDRMDAGGPLKDIEEVRVYLFKLREVEGAILERLAELND